LLLSSYNFCKMLTNFVMYDYFCQAQPKLQVKHSLKAELALLSLLYHPPPPPPGIVVF
jgi:hypothetical protein